MLIVSKGKKNRWKRTGHYGQSYPNISSKWFKNPSKISCPLRTLFRSAGSAVSNPTITWHLSSLSGESREHIHISLAKPCTLYTWWSVAGQKRCLKRHILFQTPSIWIVSIALFFLAGRAGMNFISPSLRIFIGAVMMTYLAVNVTPCWFVRRILPPAFDLTLSSSFNQGRFPPASQEGNLGTVAHKPRGPTRTEFIPVQFCNMNQLRVLLPPLVGMLAVCRRTYLYTWEERDNVE